MCLRGAGVYIDKTGDTDIDHDVGKFLRQLHCTALHAAVCVPCCVSATLQGGPDSSPPLLVGVLQSALAFEPDGLLHPTKRHMTTPTRLCASCCWSRACVLLHAEVVGWGEEDGLKYWIVS